MTVNYDTAQVLVAAAAAVGRVAAVHFRIQPRQSAGVALRAVARGKNRPPRRPKLAPATGPEGEVVRIRDVNTEGEVATIQRATELRRRGVRNTPIRVHGVCEAGVGDEPIKGRSALGHRSARLQQYREAVVPTDVLEHASSQPLRNDRAERSLRVFILFPGWVVAQCGALRRGGDPWHDQFTMHNGIRDAVERTQFARPRLLGLHQRCNPRGRDDRSSFLVARKSDEVGE